jgi:hypothetical protein
MLPGRDEFAMNSRQWLYTVAYSPNYVELAFSEVNPDNISVYAQTHKRSAPVQPCAVSKATVFETVRRRTCEKEVVWQLREKGLKAIPYQLGDFM